MPEMENPVEPSGPHLPAPPRTRLFRRANIIEASVFLAFTVFFLAYGLTPLLGGDGLGLVGADEPRYAQIAHEMLVRFDSAHTIKSRLSACVTPYLYGRPWLEKPALYYWRAMFVFQDFGVHDWAARLPSTSFAFVMVVLIYLHMRRFRPGGHLDAALITVASAAIIALREARRPICRWPRRWPSDCSAGMPGTRRNRNSGFSISISLPAWPRWPKDRWRRFWRGHHHRLCFFAP